jgi:hypothetical protein
MSRATRLIAALCGCLLALVLAVTALLAYRQSDSGTASTTGLGYASEQSTVNAWLVAMDASDFQTLPELASAGFLRTLPPPALREAMTAVKAKLGAIVRRTPTSASIEQDASGKRFKLYRFDSVYERAGRLQEVVRIDDTATGWEVGGFFIEGATTKWVAGQDGPKAKE